MAGGPTGEYLPLNAIILAYNDGGGFTVEQ